MIDLAQVIPPDTSAEHRLELEKCLSQLFLLLIRIFIPGFSLLSPVSDEKETYGLNPEAQYNDQEFQQMLGVTDKTTYRWRNNELIAYFKGAGGGKGGKIWYTGQAIIDFYRTYRVAKRLKLLKPIFKEIPKGHV